MNAGGEQIDVGYLLQKRGARSIEGGSKSNLVGIKLLVFFFLMYQKDRGVLLSVGTRFSRHQILLPYDKEK